MYEQQHLIMVPLPWAAMGVYMLTQNLSDGPQLPPLDVKV